MSTKNILSPEEAEQKIENIYKNLMARVDAIYRSDRKGSVDTRRTYYGAESRFCHFLAENYRLKNIKNMEARHLYSYVDYLQSSGKSASYIDTTLSGIRFYHERSGSKNRLPENKALNLEKRHPGKFNRAWTKEEIEKACNIAFDMGAKDVNIALRLGAYFGLRINETVRVRVYQVEDALNTGQFHVLKGKGGQRRDIPIDTKEQTELLKRLLSYAKKNGKNPDDYLLCDNHKDSVYNKKRRIQRWIDNHREKFIDPDRASKVEPGKKPRSTERLGFHSLRHYYEQQYEKRLRAKSTMTDKQVRKEASESLGHHRISVTKIYTE